MDKSSKKKKYIGALRLIILNIFIILIFLSGLELAIRANFIDYLEQMKNEEGEDDPSPFKICENKKILYEYLPNYFEEGVRITNDYGMRNTKDFSLKKDKNIFRIIVLGDSVTGPPDLFRTYPQQLQELLDKRNDTKNYEVLNFGVNGYSTKQELEVLKTKALQFNPDMIIIGYVMNDPEMATIPGDYFKYYNVKALGFLMSKINILKIRIFKTEDYLERIYRPDSDTWGGVVTSLEEIKKISEEKNITVMFVLFPLIPPPEEKISKPLYPLLYEQASNEAMKNGFVIINLFEVFNEAGFDAIRIDKSDGVHYNTQGYSLAAREIMKIGIEKNTFE